MTRHAFPAAALCALLCAGPAAAGPRGDVFVFYPFPLSRYHWGSRSAGKGHVWLAPAGPAAVAWGVRFYAAAGASIFAEAEGELAVAVPSGCAETQLFVERDPDRKGEDAFDRLDAKRALPVEERRIRGLYRWPISMSDSDALVGRFAAPWDAYIDRLSTKASRDPTFCESLGERCERGEPHPYLDPGGGRWPSLPDPPYASPRHESYGTAASSGLRSCGRREITPAEVVEGCRRRDERAEAAERQALATAREGRRCSAVVVAVSDAEPTPSRRRGRSSRPDRRVPKRGPSRWSASAP